VSGKDSAYYRRKKKAWTCYLTVDQHKNLHNLHNITKIPIAVLIREGIDLVLEQYRHRLGND